MSRYLQNLQPNDWIEMRGPVGDAHHTLEATASGLAAFAGNRSQVSHTFAGLICYDLKKCSMIFD
jgi:hypothetical protein